VLTREVGWAVVTVGTVTATEVIEMAASNGVLEAATPAVAAAMKKMVEMVLYYFMILWQVR